MSETYKVQKIHRDGKSDYHVNFYRGYFAGENLRHVRLGDTMEFPLGTTAQQALVEQGILGKDLSVTKRDVDASEITGHLIQVFDYIFNPNSAASSQRVEGSFMGQPLVKFSARLPVFKIKMPKDDYVIMKEMGGPSLCATTVHYTGDPNDSPAEIGAKIGSFSPIFPQLISPSAGAVLGKLAGTFVIPDDLGKHFLCGRRSWRIGFDKDCQHHFIETLAFERYSDGFYNAMDSQLSKIIDSTWTEFILNFAFLIGSKLEDVGDISGIKVFNRSIPNSSRLSASYPEGISAPIYYQKESFEADNVNQAKTAYEKLSWFQSLLSSHPGLSFKAMP